jgi:hypothetical protein
MAGAFITSDKWKLRAVGTATAAVLIVAGCTNADSLTTVGAATPNPPSARGDAQDGNTERSGGAAGFPGGKKGQSSSGAGGSDTGGTSRGGGGAAGFPGGSREDSIAVGAPVRMPKIVEVGDLLPPIKARIEADLLAQCGGQMCLTLVVAEADPDLETCQFAGTDPKGDTLVKRGTTVKILAGTKVCTQQDDLTGGELGSTSEGGGPTHSGEGESQPAEGEQPGAGDESRPPTRSGGTTDPGEDAESDEQDTP